MKKLIFISILIIVFFGACAPDSDEGNNQYYTPPDTNLSFITVYLNGHEPSSRAMNLDIAKMGCDYFEVVFVYNRAGAYEPARGQWKIGETARIKDVFTTDTGVNYGGVDIPTTNDQGAAILLAGKSDKTIMAIGRLAAGSTTITTNTKSVTFEVAAIKAGLKFDPGTRAATSESSFLTAAGSANPALIGNVNAGNTRTQVEEISTLEFNAFKLDRNTTTRAVYRFSLQSTSFSAFPGGLRVMADRAAIDGSIILGGAAGYGAPKVEKRQPSYTMQNGGNIEVASAVKLDEITVVALDNNTTNGIAFVPEVQFTITTTGTVAGSVFALVFEIPVYALNSDSVWYIRPGYSVFKYELDDGTGGLGGAVLIKTGDLVISDTTAFKIEVKHAPTKWRYRWAATQTPVVALPASTDTTIPRPVAEYDRVFRDTGIQVELQELNGTPMNGSPVGTAAYIDGAYLSYKIGGLFVRNNYVLPDNFYGLIEVTVIFTHWANGLEAYDKFYILVSSRLVTAYDYANIDILSTTNVTTSGIYPTIINNHNALQDFFNNINSQFNRIKIVRLNGSFNIESSYTFQGNKATPANQTNLIMFVSTATNDNVVLGRGGSGNRILGSGTASGLIAFYFGKWPFEGLIDSPAALANTRNFTVNAYASSNTKMISDAYLATLNGVGGGIYNVQRGKGLTVLSPNQLH